MLSPDSRLLTSDNDSSCVLKITTAYGSLLLTGDIEAGAESWLLDNQRDKLQSDVLLAPHHGSNTSSTLPFLKAVQPKMVLIPSGYRNQFGHPHPAVLNRYQQLDIKWLSSANSGAVQVLINKIGLTVTSQRQEFAKYWQSRERAIWNSTFLTVDEKQ
jgi:competence protein ComEC